VLPWLRGVTADQSRLQADQGVALAQFLKALHMPAPPEAPRNPHRGVPLARRAPEVEGRMQRLEGMTDLVGDRVRAIWRQALAAPIDVADTWIHGDLHACNVLVDEGRLSAIIDWGDVCQGDCATDLAAIWMLLPGIESRAVAMRAYGGSRAAWLTIRSMRRWVRPRCVT
jgi:aminoglycoside phosphotransferase (APT) family kinase protein